MAYNPDNDGGALNNAPTYASAPSTPSPYTASALGTPQYAVAQYYQQYLGRDPENNDVVNTWVMGPGKGGADLSAVQNYIANSPEAQAYAAKQKQSAAPAPAPAPQATGSPVTATGQISPAVPPSAPPATPAQKGATPNEIRYVQPLDLSTVPAYQKTQFTSAPLPDQSGTNAQQSALMNAILTNPQTLSPTVLAQMQEAQKEQALLMAKQNQQGFDSDAVSRGILGGGFNAARSAANQQQAQNAILTGNRNLDVQAAAQNRQDQLNALTASSGLAQDQQSRALAAANQGLQVQQAQAAENQFANNDALNRVLQQFGINQGVAGNAQQNYTTDISNSLGQNQQMLAVLQFLEGQRQFNDNLGFNYNQLDQSGQNSLLAYLQSLGL